MSDKFNNQEFLYWIKTMDISYEEASVLLKTTVTRIEKYVSGTLPVIPKHSSQCRLFLKLRGKRIPNINPSCV